MGDEVLAEFIAGAVRAEAQGVDGLGELGGEVRDWVGHVRAKLAARGCGEWVKSVE